MTKKTLDEWLPENQLCECGHFQNEHIDLIKIKGIFPGGPCGKSRCTCARYTWAPNPKFQKGKSKKT